MHLAHYAMLRENRLEQPMAVSSSRAIALAGRQLNASLQSHGPQAIAFGMSDRLSIEARHIITKFARHSLRGASIADNTFDLLGAIDSGQARAIWLFDQDLPDSLRTRRALVSADVVIVQDDVQLMDNLFADIFFPASTAGPAASEEPMPDWWWVQQVALAMGFRSGLQFSSAHEIRAEIARGAIV
jgi:predicted molibdopterin-dependent oxidoreductase YjgC